MKDPDRLLDHADSPSAKLLLAIDEPAPPELFQRTLSSLGATAAPLALSSSAGGATAKIAAAKVASGGLASAIGGGILAGVVLVGAVHGIGGRDEAPRTNVASITSSELPHASAIIQTTATTSSMAPLDEPTPPVVAPPEPEPKARAVASSPLRTAPEASGSAKGRTASLASELALLDEARRALDAHDTTRARLVMDRYAREVTHGQLAREAELLRGEIDRPASSSNP